MRSANTSNALTHYKPQIKYKNNIWGIEIENDYK